MSQENTINGSETADGWIQDHTGWLSRLVRSRLRHDSAAADDVVQEVSLAAWRSPQRPTHDRDLRNWLCRIALRQCALAVRKKSRAARLVSDAGRRPQAADAAEPDPLFWLINSESRSSIQQALDGLDPEARQVLIWKYVDQVAYAQIAERLHLTLHAAEYRVVKARKALRQRLTRRGLNPENTS